MSVLLSAATTGTPLHVIKKSQFDTWLNQQTHLVQNWLAQNEFTEGYINVPNGKGELDCVIMVVDEPTEFFACGDLIKKVPAGQYRLNTDDEYTAAIAFGWAIGAYQFDRYKQKQTKQAVLAIGDQCLVDSTTHAVEGTNLTRELVSTPAADMMPQHLSEATKALALEFGGEFSEIVGDDLLNENYPTIHAVGRASVHQPRLLDLTWGKADAPKITLVGKGVCFDSGGLDIKPAAGMRLMKKDMGGAAHVLGLARIIMASQLNVCLRVLIPAVENAISGNALRPGDVVKTRQGLTVEIDNTDAEGRLVLCDALNEAANDKPELIVDFATLTGAMRVALGTELPGFFSTAQDVADGITQAGLGIQDPVWQMPLHAPYKDMLKSEVADMTNCASGPFGGAITAALYLQEFVPSDINWCHFDVMAYNVRSLSGRPVGGEAFGIRAVYEYLAGQYK